MVKEIIKKTIFILISFLFLLVIFLIIECFLLYKKISINIMLEIILKDYYVILIGPVVIILAAFSAIPANFSFFSLIMLIINLIIIALCTLSIILFYKRKEFVKFYIIYLVSILIWVIIGVLAHVYTYFEC